jgi:hypothetical protein
MITIQQKYRPGAMCPDAIYSKTGQAEYDDNPLIAALDPTWTTVKLNQATTWWPTFSEVDRQREPEEREERVKRLGYSFQLLAHHVPVFKAVLANVRNGLVGRDKFVHRHTDDIHRAAEEFAKKIMADESSTGSCSTPPTIGSKSLLLSGLPGTGKSAFVERVTSILPPVIMHRDRRFPCTQVVRLRVVAQQDWSSRALAEAILTEVDLVTKMHYVAAAQRRGGGRASLFNYMIQIMLAAHNHALGLLIVDEVQLLASNREMLSFILNFSTLVGVPLLLVGTPRSRDLMQTDLHYMRRSEGYVDTEFRPFEFPSMSEAEYEAMLADPLAPRDPWTDSIEAWWPLQLTARFTPLTYKISKAYHRYCRGLIDYAIKLFVAAQILRIGTEADYLDVDAFKDAYFSCFKTSLPYLESLGDKCSFDLDKFADFKAMRVSEVAATAAKIRNEKRVEDERRLLQSEREKGRRNKPPGDSVAPKPDPVDPNDLPEASADEFL